MKATIRCLPRVDEAQLAQLTDLLIDCVEGGASVSFMLPLAPERAAAFWRRVADGVARGERVPLVAEGADGRIDGTVQLVPDNVTGGDAERLYARLGWQRVGSIPGYALWPQGGPCATTYFCREVAR